MVAARLPSRVRLRSRVIVAAALGLFAVGCGENRVVDPVAEPGLSASPVRFGEAQADSLAKGLALALGDAAIRAQLRDAFRDSPYRLHSLHLASFLRGSAGAPIAASAAAALGISVDAFLRLSESTPNLELVMPRMRDRIVWEGGEDVTITGTATTLSEHLAGRRVPQSAYDVAGNPLSIAARPLIAVRPADGIFPADPEATRLEAPGHARSSVSTDVEERAVLRARGRENVLRDRAETGVNPGIMFDGSGKSMIILPPPCEYDCGGGGGGGSTIPGVGGGGATLPSVMTKNYCFGVTSTLNSTNDRDNDLIRDDCEVAIASALSPLLNIGNWEPKRARQPYWTAARHPDRGGNVQIFFAISYLDDGGDYSTGVWSHVGDSEFIILEVINSTASKWGVIAATLSAHYDAINDDTSTYYWDDLQYPGGAYPRIWASLSKHGNYRTNAACDGSWWATCAGDYIGTRIPVSMANNLGNYFNRPDWQRTTDTQLIKCTSLVAPQFDRTGLECYWTDLRFGGWHPSKPDQVEPYRYILDTFDF